MPLKYQFNPEYQTLHSKVSGVVTVDEVIEYFKNVTDDDSIPDGFIEVVDFNEVIDFDYPNSHVLLIVNLYQKMKEMKKCLGTIFIATKPLAYGISRMHISRYEGSGLMEIVRSEEELIELLKKIRYPHS